MPEVITDTSPIQYLYQTNLLDLLPTLYGQITMPQAVANELDRGRAQSMVPDTFSLAWITVRQVQASALVPSLPNLGLGEREALTLFSFHT